MLRSYGIHHISSIVGHAQSNIDFHAGVLAQRLVKQTLNFDDKHTFHLYYGNHDGSTGLTTTFPMLDTIEGRMGGGQVETAIYAIRPDALPFWEARLSAFSIPYLLHERFGKTHLRFQDNSGLNLELVASNKGPGSKWAFNGVDQDMQFIGIEAANLLSRHPDKTLSLLTELLGYEIEAEDDDGYKLRVINDLGGTLYLAKANPKQGNIGSGSVHHIALRVRDDEIEAWREALEARGMRPTEVKERKYFRSIYFRDRGGILFELATEGPGILIDETAQTLGETFLVPPTFRNETEEILADVMPLFVREIDHVGTYSYRNRYEYELRQEFVRLK